MSSSPQYLQFVLEQLSDLPSISWRPMMGNISCIIRIRLSVASMITVF